MKRRAAAAARAPQYFDTSSGVTRSHVQKPGIELSVLLRKLPNSGSVVERQNHTSAR